VEGIVSEYQHTESAIESHNQTVYQRLQLALNLRLRRQLFIAVCDDPQQQHIFAARLHAELNQQPPAFAVGGPDNGNHATNGTSTSPTASHFPTQPPYPHWVSLKLNLKRPCPIAQIERWLRKHPPPALPAPGFQVLGIEQLTRQPATRQWRFLESIRQLNLGRLPAEASVLLWLSPPWFRTLGGIEEFWHPCTGIFEFNSHPPSDRDFEFVEEKQPSSPTDLAEKIEILFPQSPNPSPTTTTSPLKNVPTQLLEQVKSVAPESVLALLPTDLQTAISQYEPLQYLYEINQLHESGATGAEKAHAYLKVGDFYRSHLENSDPSAAPYTEIVLLAYTQAWTLLPSYAPRYWVLANDIGTLYWRLARTTTARETKIAYLQQAVNFFTTATTIIPTTESSDTWYMVQSNLGAIYGELGQTCQRAEYWQQAIDAYEQAQQVGLLAAGTDSEDAQKQQARLQWATTQNNLGTAYWHFAQYRDPVDCLCQAIAAYQQALQVYTPDTEPLHYAMLQNNLGTAYWNLAQYEKPEDNLLLAVSAYRRALNHRTRDTVPHQCAATQNNLGTAYWHLAYRESSHTLSVAEYWQQAIAAYEATLELTSQLADGVPLSFDILATHNNLALAYYQLQGSTHTHLSTETQQNYLQKALYHHLQAWQGYAQQPELRASTFRFLLQTIRACHEQFGVEGQNQALSQVPPQLLPEILANL
jgi:hypothetical protein